MFGNLINTHDIRQLFDAGRRRQALALLRRLFSGGAARTRAHWDRREYPPLHFHDIPVALRDPAQGDFRAGIREKYFPAGGRRGISPGCGGGGNEIAWARGGGFARIDAFDLVPSRIAAAGAAAQRDGLDDILHFHCRGFADFVPPGPCDVVIAEGILHHLSPAATAVERLLAWLEPGGLLIVNDYVGPSRFQWSERQLELCNALLHVIPVEMRRRYDSGKVKKRVFAPGRLKMMLSDPSEAADSAAILPALRERTEILELRRWPGTLLEPLLYEIAHPFHADDPAARRLLRWLLDTEAMVLDSGEVAPQYILAVCRKR